eukprot:CAMPEP_0114993068 /NCGR_PEP_ID=MMETSP0216-20121206/12311_1 /TAXON_ID=223996 /ORGANISM="Protocruzia adherens, Strain Boccale" /LENGTH=302 /DNA_ID=CAMNT_0002356643 /DNA_START=97 /DNA_END=1005 /DNA_ORIENTATION=+
MALYGVGLETTVNRINTEFRLNMARKGPMGIRTLKRTFKRYDHNGNNKLDIEEFEEALGAFGLFPKKVDLQALMKYYDVDDDGNVNFEEFLRGLREPLNERRSALVNRAFEIMDKDNSGFITVKDVVHVYNVEKNQDFIDGTKTKEEIVSDFLSNFEGARGNNDGKITKQEFNDYYSDISSSIPNDEYFVQLMESVWLIGEDETGAAFKGEIGRFIKMMRQKLIQRTSGSHDEYLLRQIFRDFDTDDSGKLTIDELNAMLLKLEIPLERKYTRAIFNTFDKDGNGTIEFEEFVSYIVNERFN